MVRYGRQEAFLYPYSLEIILFIFYSYSLNINFIIFYFYLLKLSNNKTITDE